MSNLFWMAVGFMMAVGLVLIFMPILVPLFNRANESDKKENSQISFKLIGVMLLVPIIAGLLYAKLGSPEANSVSSPSEPIASVSPNGMGAQANHEMSDLNAMAAKLAKKLEQNQNDGEGWALLARSYVELKQHNSAVPAFEKAIALIPKDPQLLADYVDARAVTQNHQLDEKSVELINQALKIDPNLPKALMLAGTVAFDNKDYKKAVEIWEHLQTTIKDSNSTELQNEVLGNISEARRLMNESAK
jgi:cytochrome c-type biogenesis protein CcmH